MQDSHQKSLQQNDLAADKATAEAILQFAREALSRSTSPPAGQADTGNLSKLDRIIERLSKLSTFLSTVIIGIIGLICTSCITLQQGNQTHVLEEDKAKQTSILEQDKLRMSELAVMNSFVNLLTDPKTRYVALTSIASLGHEDIALATSLNYPEDGNATAAAVSILRRRSRIEKNSSGAIPYLRNSVDFIEDTIRQYTLDIKNIKETSEKMADENVVSLISQVYISLPAERKKEIALKSIDELFDIVEKEMKKFVEEELKKNPLARLATTFAPGIGKTLTSGTENLAKSYIGDITKNKTSNPSATYENWENMINTLNSSKKYMASDMIKFTEKSSQELEKFKTAYSEGAKIQLLIDTMLHYQDSIKKISDRTKKWDKLKESCEHFITEAKNLLDEVERGEVDPGKQREELGKLNSSLDKIYQEIRPFGDAENFNLIIMNAKNLYQLLKAIVPDAAGEGKNRSPTPRSVK